jgi:gluconate 2-dehydrogenase gamma chain
MTDQSSHEPPRTHMSDEEVHEHLARRVLSRRGLLRVGATTGVAAASLALPLVAFQATAVGSPTPSTDPPAPARNSEPRTPEGFEFFNTFQSEIVNAAAGRIIPTDDNGPGAIEAGVVHFIDRQLSASYGFAGRRYEQGPYAAGTPTQGDQSGLNMCDRYRLGIQGMDDYARQVYQQAFAQLSPDQQDRILADMETGLPTTFDGTSIQSATTQAVGGGTEILEQMAPGAPGIGAMAFFQLLRSHVIAGFFADPVHGGNRDMLGWKLIGFPGAQMSYANWIDRYGVAFDGPFKGLAEYQGNFVQGG